MAIFSRVDLEAQSLTDDEIDRHSVRALIRDLCARGNTHSAVMKFPNEILSRIFTEYKTIVDASGLKTRTTIEYLLLLLNLTRVRSCWRQVALDTAFVAIVSQSDIDAISTIDAEILRYTQLITALRNRRNSHIAISKLPNEILSRIFVACKIAAAIAADVEDDQDNLPTLLTLTSVCRQWSHVARDTSDLWSTISLSRPGWVAETFRRSKQAPLRIVGPLVKFCRDQGRRDLLATILSATPRFVEVDLTVAFHLPAQYSHEMFDLLEKYGSHPAPLLQGLRLSYEWYDRDDDRLVMEGFPPVLINLPYINVKSLQSMTLKNIVPTTVPTMPRLTVLIIETYGFQSEEEDESYLSVRIALNILRNTPVVETASLAIVSSTTSALTTLTDSPPILLSYLWKLSIVTTNTIESVMFSRLDLPALRETSISYVNDADDPGLQAGGDLSHLQLQVSRSIPSDIENLKITANTEPLQKAGAEYKLRIAEDSNIGRHLFELVFLEPPVTDQQISIFQALPLGRLTSLIIGMQDYDEAVAWSAVIPLLVHLKHITIDTAHILRLLASSPNGGDPQNTVCNPDLETVTFERNALESLDEWALLISICGFRHDRGKPIQHLTVEMVGWQHRRYATQLSRLVKKLEMSPDRGAISDSDESMTGDSE
ncbi:hypothetical protein ONZ45_g3335 [Pleurotus djamor]|nr:hypothetical protein ONZ45_g3335 [Pleurotus djamor]